MKTEDEKTPNDPLDAMLAKAKWPQPSPQSMQRLEEFWKDQWSSRPLRANWIWPTAAAAAIIVGLGSVIVLVLMPPRTTPGNIGWVPVPPPARIKSQLIMMESRPPTMRELMLVGNMNPKRPTTAPITAPAGLPQAPPRDAQSLAGLARQEKDPGQQRKVIAELLRSDDPSAVGLYLQLVADRRQRTAALDALADVKEPPVQALIDQLSNSRVAIRFAAARALGRIDGPVTTEQLASLVRRNTQRREALAALLYSDGPDASAFLVDARRVPGLASTVRAVEIQLRSVQ